MVQNLEENTNYLHQMEIVRTRPNDLNEEMKGITTKEVSNTKKLNKLLDLITLNPGLTTNLIHYQIRYNTKPILSKTGRPNLSEEDLAFLNVPQMDANRPHNRIRPTCIPGVGIYGFNENHFRLVFVNATDLKPTSLPRDIDQKTKDRVESLAASFRLVRAQYDNQKNQLKQIEDDILKLPEFQGKELSPAVVIAGILIYKSLLIDAAYKNIPVNKPDVLKQTAIQLRTIDEHETQHKHEALTGMEFELKYEQLNPLIFLQQNIVAFNVLGEYYGEDALGELHFPPATPETTAQIIELLVKCGYAPSSWSQDLNIANTVPYLSMHLNCELFRQPPKLNNNKNTLSIESIETDSAEYINELIFISNLVQIAYSNPERLADTRINNYLDIKNGVKLENQQNSSIRAELRGFALDPYMPIEQRIRMFKACRNAVALAATSIKQEKGCVMTQNDEQNYQAFNLLLQQLKALVEKYSYSNLLTPSNSVPNNDVINAAKDDGFKRELDKIFSGVEVVF